MNILLDTQAFVWLASSPLRFKESVRAVLVDPRNRLFLSAASSWEIAIKVARGKLSLPLEPSAYVPSRMHRHSVTGLSIEHRHTLHVITLPPLHNDPFDRLLVAQAQIEEMALLTSDRQVAAYEVEVILA